MQHTNRLVWLSLVAVDCNEKITLRRREEAENEVKQSVSQGKDVINYHGKRKLIGGERKRERGSNQFMRALTTALALSCFKSL